MPAGLIADAALRSASFAEIAISTPACPEILRTSTPADSRQTPPSPPPPQRPFLARLWPPEWLNPDAARVDLRQEDPTRSGPACASLGKTAHPLCTAMAAHF